jgi:hypothetical protein
VRETERQEINGKIQRSRRCRLRSHDAGVKDEKILFIINLPCHRSHSSEENCHPCNSHNNSTHGDCTSCKHDRILWWWSSRKRIQPQTEGSLLTDSEELEEGNERQVSHLHVRELMMIYSCCRCRKVIYDRNETSHNVALVSEQGVPMVASDRIGLSVRLQYATFFRPIKSVARFPSSLMLLDAAGYRGEGGGGGGGVSVFYW